MTIETINKECDKILYIDRNNDRAWISQVDPVKKTIEWIEIKDQKRKKSNEEQYDNRNNKQRN